VYANITAFIGEIVYCSYYVSNTYYGKYVACVALHLHLLLVSKERLIQDEQYDVGRLSIYSSVYQA